MSLFIFNFDSIMSDSVNFQEYLAFILKLVSSGTVLGTGRVVSSHNGHFQE